MCKYATLFSELEIENQNQNGSIGKLIKRARCWAKNFAFLSLALQQPQDVGIFTDQTEALTG